jgi:hypothetical protein
MREDRNADRILMGKFQGKMLFRNPMHIHDVSIKWMLEFKFDSNARKSTNKMQQFHKFMCGSTCFGRLPDHHQEHTIALGASGINVRERRLERCWSWSGRLLEVRKYE